MPIFAPHIRRTLDEYVRANPNDIASVEVAYHLLDKGADLSDRSEFRGHATAGALLVSPERRVLQIHHRALKRWLLPGGHLEPADDTLIEAAQRELAEETGIAASAIEAIRLFPVHVDVHPIPANPTKGEPDHRHIDFRFAFRTIAEVTALQLDEVTDSAWRPLGDLGPVLCRRVAEIL